MPTVGDLGRIALFVGSYQFLQNAHFFTLSVFIFTIIQEAIKNTTFANSFSVQYLVSG